MRKINYLFLLIIAAGCVQPSYKRTIVFRLQDPNLENVRTVGVRGSDRPLSWNSDYPMSWDKNLGVYTAVVSITTGYKSTEMKFTVNGEFEMKEGANRKITFRDKDTIYYSAKFNQP